MKDYQCYSQSVRLADDCTLRRRCRVAGMDGFGCGWINNHSLTKEIILPTRPKQFKPPQWRPPAAKVADSFYSSSSWKELRSSCLARDNHTCVVEGCNNRAIVADHIVSRRAGGADALHNLRSLCRLHDNQARERNDGTRREELGNDLSKWL
jgi:hypothetical protein